MHEIVKIQTKDGRSISATCFLPSAGNGKVIIIGSGAAVTQRHYRAMARFFMKKDYAVVTFDYRGVGKSAPNTLKGFAADLKQWAVLDTDAAIRFVRTRFTNHELIFMGHGIGGELVGLVPASQYIHKLVLVNTALSCRKLWPWRDRFRISVMKFLVSGLHALFGYYPGSKTGFLRDLPKGVLVEWSGWCSNPNGLFDIYPENNYRKLQVPLLAFSFSDDWLTPEKAVSALLSYFSSAHITWHHLQPQEIGASAIGNGGFFEAQKKCLWLMVHQWIGRE